MCKVQLQQLSQAYRFGKPLIRTKAVSLCSIFFILFDLRFFTPVLVVFGRSGVVERRSMRQMNCVGVTNHLICFIGQPCNIYGYLLL